MSGKLGWIGVIFYQVPSFVILIYLIGCITQFILLVMILMFGLLVDLFKVVLDILLVIYRMIVTKDVFRSEAKKPDSYLLFFLSTWIKPVAGSQFLGGHCRKNVTEGLG